MVAKIGGFTLARVPSETESLTAAVGRKLFQAPEVWDGFYNNLADIWSFGMLVSRVLFSSHNLKSPEKTQITQAEAKLVNTSDCLLSVIGLLLAMKRGRSCHLKLAPEH
jgi:hypothetical protein